MCMAGATFPLRLWGSGRLAHSAAMSGPEPAQHGVKGSTTPQMCPSGCPRHKALPDIQCLTHASTAQQKAL